MFKTIRDNHSYFVLMGMFIVTGGLYLAISDKVDAIYYFSDNRSQVLDEAFRFITTLGEEPMYFLACILALAVRLRHSLLLALTGLSVMALSFFLKAIFGVDRPAAFFARENLMERLNFVHGVDLHTGATSFPSGHAMSAFALYSMVAFLLPAKKRYGSPLFVLALLVAISRVYLVQHFWSDVYVGSIIGVLMATVYFSILGKNNGSWLDRSLINIFTKKWS